MATVFLTFKVAVELLGSHMLKKSEMDSSYQ